MVIYGFISHFITYFFKTSTLFPLTFWYECKVFHWHWIICIFLMYPPFISMILSFSSAWFNLLLFYLSITGSDSLMDTTSSCWSRKDSYGLGKWRTFLLRSMTWKTKYQVRACPWSWDFLSSITSSCAAALRKMDRYTRKGRTSQQQRWGLRHRRMDHRNWWRMLWLMKL